jgi:hypothetical protein
VPRRARPALLGLLVAFAWPAAAQHPPPPGPRPLHQRLASAELAALVRVERVDEGRIALRLEQALLGEPPESFEVKRSPLAPPPLATGDRALLLLRGARPPYVLADAPSEVIRISDDAMAARWAGALRAVLASRGDEEALVKVYLGWIESGPESLRELGAAGLRALAESE